MARRGGLCSRLVGIGLKQRSVLEAEKNGGSRVSGGFERVLYRKRETGNWKSFTRPAVVLWTGIFEKEGTYTQFIDDG